MQELEQHPGDLESVSEPQLQCTDTKSEKQDSNIWTPLDFQFDNVIRMTGAWRDFNPREIEDSMATFTKGCKWAPDGTCILTNSDDHMLRIFNLPESIYGVSSWDIATNKLPSDLDQAVSCREGGTIYDFCWYPGMTSLEPLTCCIASCSRKSPVHLWDAFNGSLRASYSPYNQYDEVEAAHSVAFSADGQKLYCGSENVMRIFDLAKPGRQCEKRNLKCSSLMPQERQAGIVSCIATNPTEQKIYAVGSYQKTLGIYGEPDGALLCLLKAHVGGVTHIQFSPDGTKLFSGGRKDPEIFCWDLRCPGKFLTSYQRTVLTNQRIYFDISGNGKYLVSGK
ncbi:hypothetical protein B566_EDAN016548 [Ephemera danica]|nr:hypothetical protein B566_EDAN016548 [Ephemera danica]